MFTAFRAGSSRKKKAIAAGAAVALLVSGTAVATALPGNKVGLLVADNEQLTDGVRLMNKTLQAIDPGGAIYYVYLESNSGNISQVRFFLYDEDGTETLVSSDTTSPYVMDNMGAATPTRATAAATSTNRGASNSSSTTARSGTGRSSTGSATEESKPRTHTTGSAHLQSAFQTAEDGDADSDEESSSDEGSQDSSSGAGSTSDDEGSSTEDDTDEQTATTPRASTGGSTSRTPAPSATTATAGFDTTGLASGLYSVVAEVTAKGGVFDLQADFAIDNGATSTGSGTAGTRTTPSRETVTSRSTDTGTDTEDSDDGESAEEGNTGTTSGGGTECEEFADGDSKDTCQGPMDGEAGEIQAYVAELRALFKDEQGMKDAGLFLDPGSHNHYQVYASKWKKEWPSGARVAHLIADDGGIKGAQIDTSGGNSPEWLRSVPNSGGDGGHTHMDGKGGYWHDPH